MLLFVVVHAKVVNYFQMTLIVMKVNCLKKWRYEVPVYIHDLPIM